MNGTKILKIIFWMCKWIFVIWFILGWFVFFNWHPKCTIKQLIWFWHSDSDYMYMNIFRKKYCTNRHFQHINTVFWIWNHNRTQKIYLLATKISTNLIENVFSLIEIVSYWFYRIFKNSRSLTFFKLSKHLIKVQYEYVIFWQFFHIIGIFLKNHVWYILDVG